VPNADFFKHGGLASFISGYTEVSR
jgi:hypothetical protein